MAVSVTSPVLIGRGPELDRLAAAVASRDGRPAFILVAGEAGVGKTRFLREVAARAKAIGGQVLEGGCVQVGTEGLPYGPLIEALRGLSHALPPAELDELLGSGRADLARLMPRLQGAGLPLPSEPPDGSAQGRLFEHLLFFFERLATRAPLLIVFEDVHWVDRSTLDLLSFLARNLRQGPIVLVVSYRSDELHRRHPLLPFLAEQERSGRAERLELGRFDRFELAAQLAAILGAQADPELVESIMARSEGNAFYAEELLAAGTTGRLPDSLREVLLERVATMSESAQALLRLASAGGTRIAPALLASVSGMDEVDLDRALGEAIARHILVPGDGAAEERYAFRHALVQEAVYGDLLPGERSRLHAAFARALAAGVQPDGEAFGAAELAYHWQAAHDLPSAFDAWIRAALAAEAIYAFAEARASFEHALDLWDQVPDAAARAPLDRVDLLVRAAFHAAGPAPIRSAAYIRDAIKLVDPTTDPTRAGLLQERLGQYSWLLTDLPTTIAAYREAVRLVPVEPPSAARSWVLSGLGRYSVETDRPAEAMALCEEALSVARAADARQVESRALVPLGKAMVMLGDVETGLATIRRAYEIAHDLGDVHEAAGALTWLVYSLVEARRNEEALAVGLETEAYASRHGLGSPSAFNALWMMACALHDLGRWDEAADALVRAERYAQFAIRELELEALVMLLETLRGQFEAAERRVSRVRFLAGRHATWTAATALAELALWRDDPLAAREAVFSTIAAEPGIPVRFATDMLAVGIRAEADLAGLARSRQDDAELRDSSARGAELLAQMRAVAADAAAFVPISRPLVAAWLVQCEAEFSRLQVAADPDRWAGAAAAWATVQVSYLRGYALMREAEATLALHRDRPRAARALDEAREIAIRLGAVPLRHATEVLAARAGIVLGPAASRLNPDSVEAGDQERADRARPSVGAAPRDRHDLTPREREVLVLVAAGRSDGEIADALFISKKTASYHVAMIKSKLGAGSRVEIATDAIGLGLLDPRTSRSRASNPGSRKTS